MNKSVKMTTVTLFSSNDSDPPDNLPDFIKWLEWLLVKVPIEYHDTARIDISSDSDGVIEIEVSYMRPMTDEETEHEEEQRRSSWAAEARRLETALEKVRQRLAGSS